MLNNIRIVLVNPSHPGNIGAVARAMKNMGLSHLYLVAPEAFPHSQANAMAAGADDILTQAVITADLPAALAGCEIIYGSSARSRSFGWLECDARQCASQIMQEHKLRPVALVFGRESSGLTNAEMACCQYHVYIPTEPHFGSLNLAAAVQILAYELRMATLLPFCPKPPQCLASYEETSGLYAHLEETLHQIEFLDPKKPKQLMQRLRRLFNRAQLEVTEVNILRGILTAINKHVSN